MAALYFHTRSTVCWIAGSVCFAVKPSRVFRISHGQLITDSSAFAIGAAPNTKQAAEKRAKTR